MNTIELNIAGMTCGACVAHVTKGLQKVTGVEKVAVDLISGKATISGHSLDASVLSKAVEAEGYGASSIPKASSPSTQIPLKSSSCSCCEN